MSDKENPRLGERIMNWWTDIPEPVFDSSVRAPQERFWPIIVSFVAIVMVAIIVGQALQRAGYVP